jgi:hypothetical protein
MVSLKARDLEKTSKSDSTKWPARNMIKPWFHRKQFSVHFFFWEEKSLLGLREMVSKSNFLRKKKKLVFQSKLRKSPMAWKVSMLHYLDFNTIPLLFYKENKDTIYL